MTPEKDLLKMQENLNYYIKIIIDPKEHSDIIENAILESQVILSEIIAIARSA